MFFGKRWLIVKKNYKEKLFWNPFILPLSAKVQLSSGKTSEELSFLPGCQQCNTSSAPWEVCRAHKASFLCFYPKISPNKGYSVAGCLSPSVWIHMWIGTGIDL